MTKVIGYAVQIISKETGKVGYLYNNKYHSTVHGAIFKNRKKAEAYILEDKYHSKKVVEVEITIKD